MSGKKNHTMAIIGNGSLKNIPVSVFKNYSFLIATDKSSLMLVKNGIIPDMSIGDFDTVSGEAVLFLKQNVPVLKQFPAAKNYTDLELAVLEAVKFKPRQIDIYGATGSRLDHTLAAVYLLEMIAAKSIKAGIVDCNNRISLVVKKINLVPCELPYFSVFALDKEAQISISGSRYNLRRYNLKRGLTVGVSNEISGTVAKITVHKGKIILIRSRD